MSDNPKFLGYAQVKRSLTGNKDNVPQIAVIHLTELKSAVAISNMVKNVIFEKTASSWGRDEYTAVVENTTGINFDSFSIKINCLNKDGVTIYSTSAYVSNWNSGTKTTFKLSYLPSDMESFEIIGYSYY